MPGKWLNSLKEESKHTTAALREGQSRRPIGPATKRKTPKNLTDKTDRTHRKNLPPLKTRTDKTDRTSEDDQLGLIATWSVEFGYVSLHDPTTGEWWDLRTTDAPGWAMGEARRRKELYKSGNQRAYRLTARAKRLPRATKKTHLSALVDTPQPSKGAIHPSAWNRNSRKFVYNASYI